MLTALNWKNRCVNGVEKKKTALRVFSRKKAALTALNWKKIGVNGVEKKKTSLKVFSQKKSGVNGVEPEK